MEVDAGGPLFAVFLGLGGLLFGALLWNAYVRGPAYEAGVVSGDATSVHLGRDSRGRRVHLRQAFRTMHAQVIGTTSAGKTESVILPWAIRDIECGNGLLIIDGKADRGFLDKLHAYACRAGRERDFQLFSLSNPELSVTFNPLTGGTPQEVAERVFASFTFENEYYRNLQYKMFSLILQLLAKAGVPATFTLVRQLLVDAQCLRRWAEGVPAGPLSNELLRFSDRSERERNEATSGLEAAISHFSTGELARLYNDPASHIQLDEVLGAGRICYFQLPSMYYPFLAEATGKLVLQCLQSAIARRHLARDGNRKPRFFSVFLDDFQDYIYEGFGALLNKSRSANVSVVFSHQALGDLEKVSPAFRNVVLTNTNVKCVMRTSDPETAEYFAKVFGTKAVERTTDRVRSGGLGRVHTGDQSLRVVEEFRFHPNDIKGLGLGQGIVSIPHPRGTKVMKVNFVRREDLHAVEIPRVEKPEYVLPEPPPKVEPSLPARSGKVR